ncbi:MAG: hypothetical protein VX704_04290, partial [Verrucomicrobiota bacterium]|nr:hypothetical protein [Verrucomicrobiota bacterium]
DIAGATTMTYTLGQSEVGKTLKVTASYTDAEGTAEGVTSAVTASVANVNDTPINTIPGLQTVAEDTPLAITGLAANDPDGDLVTTELSVTNGILTVSLAEGATISAGANSSSTLTLNGTQAQINAALGTVSYQGNLHFNGSDTLTMLSSDSTGTPLTDSDTVPIKVNAIVSQYPYIPMMILARLEHQSYTALEGDAVSVYVGNELRAKGTVQIESGVPVVDLMVNVDAAVSSGESLSDVFVESSTGAKHQFINKTKLVSGGVIGNKGRYLLTDGEEQTLSFMQGWNFVSMYVRKGVASTMTPVAYFGVKHLKVAEIRTYEDVYNPSDPLNGMLSN